MLDRLLLHGKGRQNISCRFPVQQEAETAFKLDPWSQGGNTKPNFRRKAGVKSADITVMLRRRKRQTSPRGDNHNNKQELWISKVGTIKPNPHHIRIVLCTPGRIQRWAPLECFPSEYTDNGDLLSSAFLCLWNLRSTLMYWTLSWTLCPDTRYWRLRREET